jgi:AraC-like DNA-binding protein
VVKETPTQYQPTQEPLLLHQVLLKRGYRWQSVGEEFLLIFAKKGRGRIQFNDTVAILRPGDVLVLDAQQPLAVSAAQTLSFEFDTFSVSLSHLALIFGTTDLSLRQRFERECRNSKFYPARSPVACQCHKLIKEMPLLRTVQHRTHLLSVAAIALAEPLEKDTPGPGDLAYAQERFAQRVRAMSGDSLLRLSATEAARQFACSRRHLNRLFHQHFGASFTGLRLELRLLKALTLLRNPQSKVIWVAHQSGFNHLRLFNQHFKRRFGQTPSQWRQLNLGSQTRLYPQQHFNQHGREGIPFPGLTPSAAALLAGRRAANLSSSPGWLSLYPTQTGAAPLIPSTAPRRGRLQSQTAKTLWPR